ncbi:hypothetical protein, partial [Pseudomonas sp. O11]
GELLQQALWQGKGTPVSVEPDPSFSLAAAPQATAELPPVPGLSDSETLPLGGPVSDSETFSENAQGDLLLAVADRRWRVRGWKKNLGPEQMRVNVQVRREVAEEHVTGREAAYYVDSFDLYAAKARYSYLKQASIELGVPEEIIKRDLGK